jgi:hypothetical protein
MEQTHQLLNAIILAHTKLDTGADLPPSMLNHIEEFTQYFSYTNVVHLTDNL